MIAEIFDSGLQANSNYSITISVKDEHFEGDVSTMANFSKSNIVYIACIINDHNMIETMYG